MLSGLVIFLLLAAAGLAAEVFLVDRLRHTPVNDWLADHVYLPALRMPALVGFVLGCYPALYGLKEAPSLSALVSFDWFGQALNLLFIVPLLFSLLPVAGRLPGLILPVQGVALTALLFAPLAAAHGVDAPAFRPDGATLFALATFGFGGHLLGARLVRRVPSHGSPVTYDAIVLCCQAPVIFFYGRALGMQL